MPTVDTIIAVLVAGLLLSATPGPSMFYVLSRSVGQSRAAGLASALGLALGGMVLAVATAVGLGALFREFPGLVTTLRYVGSAYLIWLGIGIVRDSMVDVTQDLHITAVRKRPFLGIVWQGVLVELLNPKTVLFFAAFLPPFVDNSAGTLSSTDIQLQLLVLGLLVPLTAIPSDILVAFMGGSMIKSYRANPALRKAFGWIGGLCLIAIAINLHTGFI
ncbi:LysE family translocator [Sulfitobacter sp. S190]|uniref:LysE family translocator n=1 Tax=Sulfitobacter sp. S190 TaxID=2867022 RepID=UPI0021A3E9F0|nr:LysE family translocator [Sulfitobacter sp. S190]UWR20916.1 LysE family translocator [Sulfitobacter sp. S190]